MNVANDGALLTIAGRPFSVDGMAGGMLSLRISLAKEALVDLARALAKLEGVRVTSGPTIVSRGDCFLVHCSGFKLVLSSPPPPGDFARGLLSRTIEPGPALALACDLGAVFARLLAAPEAHTGKARARAPEPAAATAERPIWQRSSVLRRTALQPGKTLSRKTPLGRKTPLARGRRHP